MWASLPLDGRRGKNLPPYPQCVTDDWLPPRAPGADDAPTYAAPSEPARGFVAPTPAEKRQREHEAAAARSRPRPAIPLPPGLAPEPVVAPAPAPVPAPAEPPPHPPAGPTFARAPTRSRTGATPWRKRNPTATSALLLSILSIFLLLASFGRAFLLSVPISGIAWYMATLARRPLATGETDSGRTEIQVARWLAWIGMGLALVAMVTWVILESNGYGVDDLERDIREFTRETRDRGRN